jgi:L-malate glycosyltransferase
MGGMTEVTRTSSSPPRLLHVVLSLDPGGTERLVIELARHTAELFPTAVCCLDRRGAWASELDDAGVSVSVLNRQPGFHPALGARLSAVAEGFGATVLHCHQYTPYVYGQISRFLRPARRLVYTEHGRLSDGPPTLKRRAVNRVLGRMRAHVVAVSGELREYMVRSGFPSRNVGTIYNGIVAGPCPDENARVRARRLLGVPAGAFAVGTVARLDPVKDLGTLLTAFHSVSCAGAELVVVGDGPERETLEQQAATLGVRVRFTGARSDVRSLLPALDVFVNCSISEGVSVTILEAMAAGIPVVATAVGGTPEVLESESTGLLVPARSPGALAGALMRLTADRKLGRRLGAAGRAKLEEAFSFDRMLAEYMKLYRGEGV